GGSTKSNFGTSLTSVLPLISRYGRNGFAFTVPVGIDIKSFLAVVAAIGTAANARVLFPSASIAFILPNEMAARKIGTDTHSTSIGIRTTFESLNLRLLTLAINSSVVRLAAFNDFSFFFI